MTNRKLRLPACLCSQQITQLAGLSLFGITFLIYLNTLAPGVYGFDSAELATGVFTQGVIHPPGFPLYLLLGKLFSYLPFHDLAYRLNLMSAFFASLAVVFLYHILLQIVESRLTAWAAAFIFAVSNYFWQMALVAEVYTIFVALVMLDLLCVGKWRKTGSKKYLLFFSFFYGLTLTIHTSGVLFAPAFTWLIVFAPSWKKDCWKWVPGMFMLFLLALSLYAYLCLRAEAKPLLDYTQYYSKANLSTLSGLWWWISGKAYSFYAFGYTWQEIPAEIFRFVGYLWRNYLGIGVVFGLVGIIHLSKKNLALSLGILFIFLANIIFYINYHVMDKDTMFLPAYAIWAIFIAVGLETVVKSIKQILFAKISTRHYQNAAVVFQILLVGMGLFLNWRWVDMSQATGYTSFANALFKISDPNSVILAPWSSAVVLEYYQIVEGVRPDVTIINQSRLEVAQYYEFWEQGLSHAEIMEKINTQTAGYIDQQIQNKEIYAVEYDSVLAKKFDYMPEGPAFRLAAP